MDFRSEIIFARRGGRMIQFEVETSSSFEEVRFEMLLTCLSASSELFSFEESGGDQFEDSCAFIKAG